MAIVVMDACVLLRGLVTDLLLNLADGGLFDPIWSSELHEEWTRNLASIRSLPIDKVNYRRDQMDEAFPGARCDPNPFDLERAIAAATRAGERKDAHVVASALTAGAETILTYNMRDFPARWLQPFGLRALTPDEFCLELAGANPQVFRGGIKDHRQSLRAPSYSESEYLALLANSKIDLAATSLWLADNQEN